jgi:hypothetical protein
MPCGTPNSRRASLAIEDRLRRVLVHIQRQIDVLSAQEDLVREDAAAVREPCEGETCSISDSRCSTRTSRPIPFSRSRYLHKDGARTVNPLHVRKIDLMAPRSLPEDNRGCVLGIEVQILL